MSQPDVRLHVLLDVGDDAVVGMDAAYLEMIGWRVTNRRHLAAGPHAVVALGPDVIVLESSSTADLCAAVQEFRRPRRTADVAIVVLCPDFNPAQHREAHHAGADVVLPIRAPGLEWTARGVCTALAIRGRRADVPGFDRRVRQGAGLCEGRPTREPRLLVFDAPERPLLWRMLRAGYGATPGNVANMRRLGVGLPRPDLIIVDVDAQPDAVPFIRCDIATYPPILCITSSPSAALAQLTRVPPDGGDIRILDRRVADERLIDTVAALAPDDDGSPAPQGPEAKSRFALRPHHAITDVRR